MKVFLKNLLKQVKSCLHDFSSECTEVRVVYLHGSIPQGYAREDSDIDLAVVTQFIERCNVIDKQLEYSEFFDLRLRNEVVDLKIINHAPLAFQHAVLRNGEILFSRDEAFRADFEVRVMNQFLDFKYYHHRFSLRVINPNLRCCSASKTEADIV